MPASKREALLRLGSRWGDSRAERRRYRRAAARRRCDRADVQDGRGGVLDRNATQNARAQARSAPRAEPTYHPTAPAVLRLSAGSTAADLRSLARSDSTRSGDAVPNEDVIAIVVKHSRDSHAPTTATRADPIARYAGRVARRYSLRASDSDREDVAERLRAATAQGRPLAAGSWRSASSRFARSHIRRNRRAGGRSARSVGDRTGHPPAPGSAGCGRLDAGARNSSQRARGISDGGVRAGTLGRCRWTSLGAWPTGWLLPCRASGAGGGARSAGHDRVPGDGVRRARVVVLAKFGRGWTLRPTPSVAPLVEGAGCVQRRWNERRDHAGASRAPAMPTAPCSVPPADFLKSPLPER